MQVLGHDIDELERFSNVVIAATSSPGRDELIEELTNRGVNIIGPAETASQALTLVAHHPAEFAIVGATLAGRRDGTELADTLESHWGVRTFLIAGPA